eukprot:m.396840 g.396840  ORF g.396840 m.396840 type:complete len:140 (-) comp21116_c1_seq1:1342-1761(-)
MDTYKSEDSETVAGNSSDVIQNSVTTSKVPNNPLSPRDVREYVSILRSIGLQELGRRSARQKAKKAPAGATVVEAVATAKSQQGAKRRRTIRQTTNCTNAGAAVTGSDSIASKHANPQSDSDMEDVEDTEDDSDDLLAE